MSEAITVAAVFGVYFFPSMVAGTMGHRNSAAIWVLNTFLGWTFIGWVVALCWALTDNAADRG